MSTAPAPSPHTLCYCGLIAVKRSSKKDNKNNGREFYCCVKGRGAGACDYFDWSDAAPSKKRKSDDASSAAAAAADEPNAAADSTKVHDLLVVGTRAGPAKTTAATPWQKKLRDSAWYLLSATAAADPTATQLMALNKENGVFLSTVLNKAALVQMQDEQGLEKTASTGVTQPEFVEALVKGMLERTMTVTFNDKAAHGTLRTVLYVKDDGFDIDIELPFVIALPAEAITGMLAQYR